MSICFTKLDNCADCEVLANTPDDWPKCLGQLPIYSIIEHVKKHHSLVPYLNLTIPLKLNEELLDPVQALLVVCNLCYKQRSLNIFEMLHLFL